MRRPAGSTPYPTLFPYTTLFRSDQRREENRIAVKEQMEAMAAEAGFSIDELYGKGKGKKTPLPPKYRNPDDASQTYPGRGRKPGWLADKLAEGADMDDFLIG